MLAYYLVWTLIFVALKIRSLRVRPCLRLLMPILSYCVLPSDNILPCLVPLLLLQRLLPWSLTMEVVEDFVVVSAVVVEAVIFVVVLVVVVVALMDVVTGSVIIVGVQITLNLIAFKNMVSRIM